MYDVLGLVSNNHLRAHPLERLEDGEEGEDEEDKRRPADEGHLLVDNCKVSERGLGLRAYRWRREPRQ